MSFAQATAAYNIDYANEISKLDPSLFLPQRLSLRVQPQMHARTIVIPLIAQQCVHFTLLVHRLRVAVGGAPATKVGIIGGGRVGVEIAQTLLRAEWSPEHLTISTRQPQDPRWMSRIDEAVTRYHDNAKLAADSDILILAMPPSQLTSVGIQIKHSLSQPSSRKIVVSVLAGVELDKICKVCACPIAVHTRVHPSLVDSVDPKAFDAQLLAAEHWAYNNTAGLQDLSLRLEQLAVHLGEDPATARTTAVNMVLGPHPGEIDRPSWRLDWDDMLSTVQRVWSAAINQLDVPVQD
ncbi:hypothetical protein ACHHYP_01263 [Achlya hypogyna]|uniref:Pyrroline-5-carboxylate reductase catalytic N-terminal domain-containing protein n=1 Tax=Achlya hypogyna TaxID=1202772 RepID=A0A1V9Z914_ACHHY|nr:hypothetical protein ACHHYP_01263 [Achlya hypogyna]